MQKKWTKFILRNVEFKLRILMIKIFNRKDFPSQQTWLLKILIIQLQKFKNS